MSSKNISGFIPLSSIPDFPFEAIWKDQYSQRPVVIVAAARKYKGKQFFKIRGSDKIVPIDELFTEAQDQVSASSSTTRPAIESVRMSEVTSEAVRWLWEGRIPIGMVTLLEGMEGIGKSMLLCAIAAAVTCGKGLPDMNLTEPANVLWLSAEDSLSYALKGRLLAAGADCDRVYAIDQIFSFDQRGVMLIQEQIAKRQPLLVVIDPIFAYLNGDANKGQDVRGITNRLKEIAEQFGCAIIFVRHINKSKGHGDDRAAGSGSIEWRAAVRSALLAGFDPDERQKRALTQTKNNFGPNAEAIGYRIDTDRESPSGARFSWTGASDLTAKRILSSPEIDDDEKLVKKNQLLEAKHLIAELLSEGRLLQKNIEAEARSVGISWRTLMRAKTLLGIKPYHTGAGKNQIWWWELPKLNGQHELDFNLVEQVADMTMLENHGHVSKPQNSDPVNPDFPPDMTIGHVTLGDDPQADMTNGHVRTKNPPNRQETQIAADMTMSDEHGHVRNDVPRWREKKINPTKCPNCGSGLGPDGSCKVCSSKLAF